MFHSSSTKHHGLFRNQILHFSLLFLLANLEVEFLSEFLKKVFSEFLKRPTESKRKMFVNKHATRDLHVIQRDTVTVVSRFLNNNWLKKGTW